MTIPEDTNTRLFEQGALPSTAPRLTRPTLDRQSPIRNWSTLFTPPSGGVFTSPPSNGASTSLPSTRVPAAGGDGAAANSAPAIGRTVSDAVGQGYRVINDYLSQGQRFAEAMRWPEVAGAVPGAMPSSSSQDPQQLLRRLMQYGADFAGMWFEVWSKMGWPGPGNWPAAGAAGPMGFPGTAAPSGNGSGSSSDEPFASSRGEQRSVASAPSATAAPERFSVTIVSERRVQSVLELRRGSWTTLLAHALRPEGHEAPAIRGVKIDSPDEESVLRVFVEVPADQPPGVYNGMIIDAGSNLPRGTLTITVEPATTA